MSNTDQNKDVNIRDEASFTSQRIKELERDLEIESLLEVVRGQAMTMKSSSDFSGVVKTFFDQVKEQLESIDLIWLSEVDPDQNTIKVRVAPNGELKDEVVLNGDNDSSNSDLISSWSSQSHLVVKNTLTIAEGVENRSSILDLIAEVSDSEKDIYSLQIKNRYGFLGIGSLDDFSEVDLNILKRFGKVFEQAYTGYIGLKTSEDLFRNLQIEASMDRIRAQSLAMRHTEELRFVSGVIYEELHKNGIENFESCGFHIVDEENDAQEVWNYQIDNKQLLRIKLPLNGDDVLNERYKDWKNRVPFHHRKVEGEELNQNLFLTVPPGMELGDSVSWTEKFGFPDPVHFHFGNFRQGYLHVISSEELSERHKGVLVRFAKVFEQAYVRFLDLQKTELQAQILKEEKQKLEETLKELKATQTQLIHSEKMASLGELTAGIAHEIQNPLNFVNNFSELNIELFEELQEEIQNEDLEEVKTIVADIKANEEKINHHGGRADAIVKSMLQHSRTTKGERVLTDINSLADEYLRLSYHGIAAKEPTFKASFETFLDPDLPKAMVTPQDIGRVFLNLLNNAFQAVHERSSSDEEGYLPLVTVKTRSVGNMIEIGVHDNGHGISEQNKSKIFQPFFTTKPTGTGTGLGLSISYDIMSSHDGDLRVESTEGKGSSFFMTLKI